MTPAEFAARVEAITALRSGDPQVNRNQVLELCCECLRSVGYGGGAGVDVIQPGVG
jgi:hypothetical protein